MSRRIRIRWRNRALAVIGLPIVAAMALFAAAIEVVKPRSKRR